MKNSVLTALITDGLDKESDDVLGRYYIEAIRRKLTPDQLLKEIGEYDLVIVRSATKVTPDIIRQGAKGKLKLIGRSGVGHNNIDSETASEYGIPVMTAPFGSTNAVAELALGLMTDLSRNITRSNESLRSGIWVKEPYEGIELRGRTVGVAGYGRIGRAIAEKCRALGMNAIAYDVYQFDDGGVKRVEKDELLAEADYVTLHMPGSKNQPPFIGSRELALMKRTAYLINTSRGENVDEEALYKALTEGLIAGVALDVHRKEGKEGQPYENPLVSLPNVLGTPHLGASTREAQRATSFDIARGAGEYLRNSVITDRVQIVNFGDSTDSEIIYPIGVQVTHDDAVGMFRQICGVFERYEINIARVPSSPCGNGKASTTFRIYQGVPEVVLQEIKAIPGVYRVTL